MNTFRYDTSQHWYKGNTHLHSTASDGALGFDQLSRLYSQQGYSFLFRTDHWVCSNAQANAQPDPILWLDGIELNGKDPFGSDYHIVCLGEFTGLDDDGRQLLPAFEKARAQGGFTILAHPLWMGNSVEEALRYPFDGVEVFNNDCQWCNGKGDSTVHWEAMLKKNPNTLALAADDAHMLSYEPDWNGGWIVINTAELSPASVFKALRAGNFYASTGPDFQAIENHQQKVYVKTSPVKAIQLVGPGIQSKAAVVPEGQTICEAEFEIPADWPAAYFHLQAADRSQAWSNALFVKPR
jgi:hypothetical protein